MKIILMSLSFALVALVACKDKEPKITSTLDIDSDIKSIFVYYAIGTKWVYEDSLDYSNIDTIELIQIENYDSNRKGVLEKGYILHYKSQKSRDFKVSVSRGQKTNFYIKMYTDVTGSGAVSFERIDGKWSGSRGVIFSDSIEIRKKMYYNVISTPYGTPNFYGVYFGQNVGLVSYNYVDNTGGISRGGFYRLIKTIKP